MEGICTHTWVPVVLFLLGSEWLMDGNGSAVAGFPAADSKMQKESRNSSAILFTFLAKLGESPLNQCQ